MNNPFIQRQMELRQRIISGFSGILVSSDEVQKGEDDLEFEKAHKDGDMHPNGKWVWVSSANRGKGDWRTINGRTHQKHTAAQGSSVGSGSQGTAGGNNDTPNAEKPGRQASKPKVDETTIDDAEYKRMYSQAKSVNDENRSMGLGIINSNISKYKKDLDDTIAKRPGAKATIKQLQDKLTKFVSQKKAVEDVIAELEKKGGNASTASTATTVKTDNNAGSKSVVPTTVSDALKQAQIDTDKIKSLAKKVNIAHDEEDIDEAEQDIRWCEKRLKEALTIGDPDRIKNAANNLASDKLFLDEYKKNLVKKKKERKRFIDSTSHDFTEDQVQKYLDEYNTDKTHSAVIRNKYTYSIGNAINTSATIEVGQGKSKKFDKRSLPSWRPIGMIEYLVRNKSSDHSKIKIPVQSWSEIENNLSDTESFTLYLYKHPKQ